VLGQDSKARMQLQVVVRRLGIVPQQLLRQCGIEAALRREGHAPPTGFHAQEDCSTIEPQAIKVIARPKPRHLVKAARSVEQKAGKALT
jgi:hypothetical protein